jgi:hypothetical protein
VLLRALCSSSENAAFTRAAQALAAEPECFEDLLVLRLFAPLRDRGPLDPLTAIPDEAARTVLAQLLMREQQGVTLEEAEAALETLKYRHLGKRQRRIRGQIAEAERRGDWSQVAHWTAEKLKVDREIQNLGSDLASPAAG